MSLKSEKDVIEIKEQSSLDESKKEAIQITKHENISSTKLFDLLKEHLTCEMYDAILTMIDTSHIVLKIFLGLFLVAANALNAYMTIRLIMSYLQYDVISTSRTLYETPTVFPMVTICNQNSFTSLDGLGYVNQVFSPSYLTNLSYLDKNEYTGNTFDALMTLISDSSDETKKTISHSLDDVLIGCKFNFIPCTSANFSWVFDKVYGNCYRFNSGFNSTGQKADLKTSSLAGSYYGLQLDLYVNYHQNLTLLNSIWSGLGAIIRIDNVSNVIDHGPDGIITAGGSYTNIALGRENKIIMKKPYSNCVLDNDVTTNFNSDIYNLIVASKFSYTQQFCVIQCIQKHIIEQCGCTSQYFESVFNVSKCSSLSILTNCVLSASFASENEEFITNNCLPLCPLECNSTRFTYDISSAKLLGDPYVDIIQNNPNLAADFVTRQINADTASASIAKVNVFYDSLSYVNIEESPALDIITLIANMGGTWGLFLSVNFFSIAEIISTLIEIFYYKIEKKSNKVIDAEK